jgi:hypothetical protein
MRRHAAVLRSAAAAVIIATSVGDVLAGRGADIIIIDDPLKPEEALSEAPAGRQPMVRP